jgi:UDP-N-acetylglucosamine diphosphorylase/glucosamine-1-phosphate N-acetyltransferase
VKRALVLFEDRHWRQLRPLTDLTPVPALRFGASDLAGRWSAASGLPLLAIEARHDPMAAWADAPAAQTVPATIDEVIVINAAALPGAWLAGALETRAPSLWLGDGRVVGARLPVAQLAGGLGRGEGFEAWLLSLALPGFGAGAEFLTWPWDFVTRNGAAIAADLAAAPGSLAGDVHPSAQLLEPGRIRIAAGARVDPLAVLDARGGPILLEAGVVVLPHTVVQGPCVVGAGTQLLGGFVGQSTIGPGCRIAGEVDSCVWQGWANKRHHGFVGHSVVGEWVNLGALTTTSDLKNNYGEVRVWVEEHEVATGTSKVGSILGAHVKTGIGTLLPTGAAVGTGANLFGGGRFTPKRTPSFAWWDGERSVEHDLERFLATARTAMSRRGRVMLPAEERLLRSLHAGTARERREGAAG